MKPNVKFLEKVRDGGVKLVFRYSPRTGGTYRFVGGEQTAKKHAAAGLISMPGVASLGRPSLARLTEAGNKALSL